MTREPIYVAQGPLLEPGAPSERWFTARAAEARAKGGRWPRFSVHPEWGVMLIEVWDGDGWPSEQGDFRLALAPPTPASEGGA